MTLRVGPCVAKKAKRRGTGVTHDSCSSEWLCIHDMGVFFPVCIWFLSLTGKTVDGRYYIHIVANYIQAFMCIMFPDGYDYFQDKNALCHLANIISDRFEERDLQLQLLPSPTPLPDRI